LVSGAIADEDWKCNDRLWNLDSGLWTLDSGLIPIFAAQHSNYADR